MTEPVNNLTDSAGVPTALNIVRNYHQRTKHRFEAYAHGPGSLDWDAQAAPFRHFAGAETVALPKFAEGLNNPVLAALLRRPFSELGADITPQPPTLQSLGALLQLSLGITAWKSYGPDRWAVRANPSSGNLHPTEAYLVLRGWADIADGVYHYRAEQHGLELRTSLAGSATTPTLFIALTSVMWREAWKYGERAFRYCQLDTGHAMAALRYASAVLGWGAKEQTLPTPQLAVLLGLDRSDDFPARRQKFTEVEEAETLLVFNLGRQTSEGTQIPEATAWHGVASTIDAYPMYQWPVIGEVAQATQRECVGNPSSPLSKSRQPLPSAMPVAKVILHRRSAQRFDARHVMPRATFVALLQALMPRAQAPWDVLAGGEGLQLLLFIHRVEGIAPGVYLFLRHAETAGELLQYVSRLYQPQKISDQPESLDLYLLQASEAGGLHRAARALHCHQDIAADACLALGMLAPFDAPLQDNPAAYRDMFRAAGLLGQVLYLSAEAMGLNGTGIGCYFDDPVHDLLGLEGTKLQSLYHFTVGKAVVDTRIETDTLHLQEAI